MTPPYFFQKQGGTHNQDWWPDQIDVSRILRYPESDNRTYAYEFEHHVNLQAVKKDLQKLLTSSQDWWPADDGHYGPFFIRLAWHSAGTYRVHDGRGGAGSGQIRFAPLNSWPDNGNLDKARRLLWPIKQKYGSKVSWADLFILVGNVALEDMGFPTLGFAGGRVDVMEPTEDGIWGSEETWLSNDKRYNQKGKCPVVHNSNNNADTGLNNPLGAVQMGLIYVNPEGPNGNPDPLLSARDIRETFGRMAMNDEETVALIAGGHSFGKCHGAASPTNVGPEPEGASLEQQGLGWKNAFASGRGLDTITSGLEGSWTPSSTHTWDHAYLTYLWDYDWTLTKSPAGAQQWTPKDYHGSSPKPIMLTSDLALKFDPAYRKISQHFYHNPAAFQQAFAKAWYKLTHRDLGPYCRCLGPEVPPPQFEWQDYIPPSGTYHLSGDQVSQLKSMLLNQLSVKQLIQVAWASCRTFRQYDKRGGPNGGRLRLEPQRSWPSNRDIIELLPIYEQVQADFLPNYVSLADLYVLGGCAAVEQATANVPVNFESGRMDATQEHTPIESTDVLELKEGDAFLSSQVTEQALVAQAHRYQLTPCEMICLVGGLRVLIGYDDSSYCSFVTDGTLANSYFTTMLSSNPILDWKLNDRDNMYYTSSHNLSASRVDLWMGSHSVVRAHAEVYASDQTKFQHDFSKVFSKVMHCDRFDVPQKRATNIQSRL